MKALNHLSRRLRWCAIGILTAVAFQTAHASLIVDFVEGAPKDRFIVKNAGSCLLSDLVLEINLSQSDGRLIFDTTDTGAGVEVFQPFEATSENIVLVSSEVVKDGDSQLAVRIETLAVGESVGFTIDVDDTLPKSELGNIRVAGSEIQNGQVKISLREQTGIVIKFNKNSRATSQPLPCSSS